MALEGDKDCDILERANFLRLEHLDCRFEFVEYLSYLVMVDVDKGPDICDTEVFEAADGVDVVSDDLWAAHAPHVA